MTTLYLTKSARSRAALRREGDATPSEAVPTPSPVTDASEAESLERLRWPAILVLVTIFIPWNFTIGPAAMSPYRLALILAALPAIIRWIRTPSLWHLTDFCVL